MDLEQSQSSPSPATTPTGTAGTKENSRFLRDNPKALLAPGAIPVLHNLIDLSDADSNSSDNPTPSTVDLAALNCSGLTETINMMGMEWRGTPRPKINNNNKPIATPLLTTPKQTITNGHNGTTILPATPPSSGPTDSEEKDRKKSRPTSRYSDGTTSCSDESDSNSDSSSTRAKFLTPAAKKCYPDHSNSNSSSSSSSNSEKDSASSSSVSLVVVDNTTKSELPKPSTPVTIVTVVKEDKSTAEIETIDKEKTVKSTAIPTIKKEINTIELPVTSPVIQIESAPEKEPEPKHRNEKKEHEETLVKSPKKRRRKSDRSAHNNHTNNNKSRKSRNGSSDKLNNNHVHNNTPGASGATSASKTNHKRLTVVANNKRKEHPSKLSPRRSKRSRLEKTIVVPTKDPYAKEIDELCNRCEFVNIDTDSEDEADAGSPESSSEPQSSASAQENVTNNNAKQFSSSLTERVKIRKRNTISEAEINKITSGLVSIPGVIPQLLLVPDPPIILPTKTNYLKAGLFSKEYKLGLVDSGLTVPESPSSSPKKKFVFPEQVDLGLGKIFIQTEMDYELPYDIWCLGVINSRENFEKWRTSEEIRRATMGGKERRSSTGAESSSSTGSSGAQSSSTAATPSTSSARKRKRDSEIPIKKHEDSWKFKKMVQNRYSTLKKPDKVKDHETDSLCECPDIENKCSNDNCYNRLTFMECPASCGDKCQNRRIQSRQGVQGIKRFMTEKKGYGVKTLEKISKDQFIIEYVGEVISKEEFTERMLTIYANDAHHYCLHLDTGLLIDGHRSGGECRFVNHSCDPNCEIQKWMSNGLSRMCLFALRDIEPGEELTYDYNFNCFNGIEAQPCFCGSANCRKVIGEKTKKGNNNGNGQGSKGNGVGKGGARRKGNHGRAVTDPLFSITGLRVDPTAIHRMKPLSKKDRQFIESSNMKIFLIRNYNKIIRQTQKEDDKTALLNGRVEKLMSSWAHRFKPRSAKNKPLLIEPTEDPKVVKMAKVAQILYELFAQVMYAKDSSGRSLCDPFMEPPPRRKNPLFYSTLNSIPSSLTGFKDMQRNILRGIYSSLSELEHDFGAVLKLYAEGYSDSTERSEICDLIPRIQKVFKEYKPKAQQALEPFIITSPSKLSMPSAPSSGSPSSSSTSKSLVSILPKFIETPTSTPSEDNDVIRCICGTFLEDGVMVQCERCCVWQHCDCVGWDYDQTAIDEPTPSTSSGRKGKRSGKGFKKVRRNSLSPIKPSGPVLPPVQNPILKAPETSTATAPNNDQVEFDLGELISVTDELPIIDRSPEEIANMDTQVIDYSNSEPVDDGPATGTPEPITRHYFCEICDPRPISREIPLKSDDEPGKRHYLTLVREEDGFIVRKNDTVYVLRDWTPEQKAQMEASDDGLQARKTFLTAGPLQPDDCDVFRIESLWIDDKGTKMAYGYNYIRPKETHHEPSRKFYPNEILRSPLHEVISIDLIHGRAWVMDTATYCKGRPIGCQEEHLYICDMRVNKHATSFDKIGKKYIKLTCTAPYAFRFFETKLEVRRNHYPHGIPSPDFKIKIDDSNTKSTPSSSKSKKSNQHNHMTSNKGINTMSSNSKAGTGDSYRIWKGKSTHLNQLLEKLHESNPEFKSSAASDSSANLSHLLERFRSRKSASLKRRRMD